MKAIAVHPGRPNSMHLEEVPEPSLDEIPGGRGVLVRVLRVGVDGTDKEINAAEYGEAPDGFDYLITGHEGLGRVLEVGPNVRSTIAPGTLVVATVRRPGTSIYDRIGLQDMTTDDVYFERGINRRHGYLTERYVEDAQYLVPLPESLSEVGVLLEPLTVAEKAINQAFEIQRRLRVWQPRRALVLGSGTIGLLATLALRLRGLEVAVAGRRPPYRNSELLEQLGATYVSTQSSTLAEAAAEHGPFDLIVEATGFSPIAFEAAEALGKNGVLVLVSVTGGDRKVEINADAINQGFVLGNKVMVGSVNASPADFASGRDDLVKAEAVYPGWLGQLLTTPVHGLENFAQMLHELTENRDAIKVYVQVADVGGPVVTRPLFVPVLLGTPRQGRMSAHAAAIVVAELARRPGVETALIDVAELPIPVDDAGEGAKDEAFAEQMNLADALVIVAPEYNHGYPGLLKHVLDTNLREYVHKAAGVVGVSAGVFGGARVIQNLIPVLRELGLVTIFWDVNFTSVQTRFDESGALLDESFVRRIDKFLDELVWMATTLRHGREHVPIGGAA